MDAVLDIRISESGKTKYFGVLIDAETWIKTASKKAANLLIKTLQGQNNEPTDSQTNDGRGIATSEGVGRAEKDSEPVRPSSDEPSRDRNAVQTARSEYPSAVHIKHQLEEASERLGRSIEADRGKAEQYKREAEQHKREAEQHAENARQIQAIIDEFPLIFGDIDPSFGEPDPVRVAPRLEPTTIDVECTF